MPTEADIEKLSPGQTLREWCYELEVKQGKNVVDAAASVTDTLDLFIWSTLSHAKKWSKGKYAGVYHFDSKAVVAEYLSEKYPALGKKTSFLQLGLFITNWKWGQAAVPWEKVCYDFPQLVNQAVLTIISVPTDRSFLPSPVVAMFPFPSSYHLTLENSSKLSRKSRQARISSLTETS